MGIGVSVFLMAVGAILAFAVQNSINGIDLTVVGYILIAAGIIGVGLFLAVFGPRNRSVATERVVETDRPVRREVI